jgi:hypothetical protein
VRFAQIIEVTVKLAELTSGDPKFRDLRVVCTTGGA